MVKPGRRKADDSTERTKRIQIRLYPADIDRIDSLIAQGYADNRSEVIRRSIAETHKWTLQAK